MPLRHLLLLGLLAALLGPAERGRADPGLAERASEALAHRALRGAEVAALVVDANDRETLFARDPDRALVPASNEKLLTAMAALATFGPTHRFQTVVQSPEPPDASGAVATLYVRGGGDPALTSEDWWRLAADLRLAGLRRVGEVVVDDGAFDAERWHPSWKGVSSRAYYAPVGALAANYGAFAVAVRPGDRPGLPAQVEVDPPVPYLRVRSRARTGPGGRPSRVLVERHRVDDQEEVALSGVVAADAPERVYYRSVADPGLYAGAVLRWQLEANGIRVEGAVRRGEVPAEAPVLIEFEGRPLAEIVRLFLKYSNNMIAEALIKALGAHGGSTPGSWTAGMAAFRAELEELGLDLEGVRLVDGSGLSRENRLTPRLLTEVLLRARRSFDFGPEFVAALPISGGDGTLGERAEVVAGEVRAKTGLLDRVVALSGYARARSGRDVVFSLLVNGHHSSDEEVMEVADRFAAAIVGAGARAVAHAAPPGAAPQESVGEPTRP